MRTTEFVKREAGDAAGGGRDVKVAAAEAEDLGAGRQPLAQVVEERVQLALGVVIQGLEIGAPPCRDGRHRAVVGARREVVGVAALLEVSDKGEKGLALDAVEVQLIRSPILRRHQHGTACKQVAEETAHH